MAQDKMIKKLTRHKLLLNIRGVKEEIFKAWTNILPSTPVVKYHNIIHHAMNNKLKVSLRGMVGWLVVGGGGWLC